MKINNNISFLKKDLIVSLLAIGIFVIIFVSLNDLFKQSNNQPYIDQGLLDLQRWNPEAHGVIVLKGDWKYYWNKLLTSKTVSEVSQTDL